MTNQLIALDENSKLQLNPITLDENYLNEWNEKLTDFVCLAKNDKPLNNCVYRVGGIGTSKISGLRYFILLKYVEAFYPNNITKNKKQKKHLASHPCIIDSNGVEKVISNQFDYPYLVKNSPIYYMNSNYYNIETGELYASTSFNSMETTEYLFLQNYYDNDNSKRGIIRISKKDGTYKLYKE